MQIKRSIRHRNAAGVFAEEPSLIFLPTGRLAASGLIPHRKKGSYLLRSFVCAHKQRAQTKK